MRLPIAAALVGLVVCLPAARAQQPGGEQLFVPPPKGWVSGFHDHQGNVELTELIPPGQTAEDWTEMLAVQVISGKPEKTPQDILKDQVAQIQKACDDVGVGPLSPGMENGFDTAMRAVACTRSKQWGKGELSLYKVLAGHERLYVVTRSWRGAPYEKDKLPVPAETTKGWLAFMQQVVLCDSRDASHPCPKTQ